MGDLDALAESIKEAERNIEPQLSFDDPFIARLDGASFKRFTSSLEKPFDLRFTKAMQATAEALYKKFQPIAVFVQSDELSLLFHPNITKNGNSQVSSHLYNGRAFKLVSVLAGAASLYFYQNAAIQGLKGDAYFDGRILSHQRPHLVFKWRAHDLRRNAINSIGQVLYGQQRIENMPLHELESDLVRNLGPLHLKYGVSNIFGTLFKKKEIMKEGFDPRSKMTVLAKRSIVEGRSIDLLKPDLSSLLNCHLWEKDEKMSIPEGERDGELTNAIPAFPSLSSRKRPSFESPVHEDNIAVHNVPSTHSNKEQTRMQSPSIPSDLSFSLASSTRNKRDERKFPFDHAPQFFNEMMSTLRCEWDQNTLLNMRVKELERQLKQSQEAWHIACNEKYKSEAENKILENRMEDISKCAQLLVQKETEVMKRISAVQRIESEIVKLKENHQIQVAQLKEQLDKNVRLIESVRQEKLSVQFEVTALKKELSSTKAFQEEKEREAEEKIKSLEHQLLDCEINYSSILKEKEESLSRMQITLDKHKRSVFEMASTIGVKSDEGADLCSLVKVAVERIQQEKSSLSEECAKCKIGLDSLQAQLSELQNSLEQSFPGIRKIADLIPLFMEKENRLKLAEENIERLREEFRKEREEIIKALEREKEMKIEEIKRIYEGELLKRDNEITKLKSQINLPPSKIEIIESSVPRKTFENLPSSPSLNNHNHQAGNWTVVNSPTRKRGKTNVMQSSPKSGESTASFWGPSALFLNNNNNANNNSGKKGKRSKKML